MPAVCYLLAGSFSISGFITNNTVGERVRLWEVDAVFHSGDVSYANGYLSNWDYFMDMISPIASKVLYLTTLGLSRWMDGWIDERMIHNICQLID